MKSTSESIAAAVAIVVGVVWSATGLLMDNSIFVSIGVIWFLLGIIHVYEVRRGREMRELREEIAQLRSKIR